MNLLLKNGSVYTGGKFINSDLFVSEGKVFLSKPQKFLNPIVIDCDNLHIIPGFVDVHTHLREPGFSYKETVKSGTMAAASAGYKAILTMPNLNPVPDNKANLKLQQDIIDRDAVTKVYPIGAITKGEKGEQLADLSEMEGAIAFSDDGRGVQNQEMMKKAMIIAKSLNKMIVAHCEDNSLLNGGYIHDGEYAKINGHKGICSASEYKPIERDIELVKEVGVKYHVCHVSAKESVQAIRRAIKEGVNVSAETAPHYLTLNDLDLKDSGDYKMNPPIRAEEDRLALIEGIKDGTISMIATDHAPHSIEEKNKGLKGSINGIVGLETAFPVLYTKLVKTGEITLEKLIDLMSVNPAIRFGLGKGIEDGEVADVAVMDLSAEYTIDPKDFISMGKSSPFIGWKVFGKCVLNVNDGKIVWKKQ